jgi:hypothetical protein
MSLSDAFEFLDLQDLGEDSLAHSIQDENEELQHHYEILTS